jgi:hypothetical protein
MKKRKETNYRQCRLVRGAVCYTAWIPVEFAKVGKILRIRRERVWEDGWVVKESSKETKSGKILEAYERNYRDHRKVTDI